MAKVCIQELSTSITDSTSRLEALLARLNPALLKNLENISQRERVEFYQWATEHYGESIVRLPALVPRKLDV